MGIVFFNKTRDLTAEILYEECHRKLYNVAYRVLNDSMEAEEVMHDVLLKYLDKKITFSTKKERDNWLVRVCINQSIDKLRKKKESGFVDLDRVTALCENEMEDDNNIVSNISIERVKTALLKLPDGYRVILSLLLFEGYDYEEVAQILGIKEVSVRSQYMRGKLKLKEIL